MLTQRNSHDSLSSNPQSTHFGDYGYCGGTEWSEVLDHWTSFEFIYVE
jgi:hypothetical protein